MMTPNIQTSSTKRLAEHNKNSFQDDVSTVLVQFGYKTPAVTATRYLMDLVLYWCFKVKLQGVTEKAIIQPLSAALLQCVVPHRQQTTGALDYSNVNMTLSQQN